MLRALTKPTIIFVALVICLLLGVQHVAAQSSEGRITLSVSPQKIEKTANPGDVITETVRITNGSASPVILDTSAKDFVANGEEGAVALTEENNQDYSLAAWINVSPETATVPASGSQDFVITISVPDTAEPGGHFGAAVFATRPPATGSTAALVSQEITTIMLLKVSGEIIESGSIASFTPTKSFWSNQDAITLESRIANDGNVHFKPSGIVRIKNMFGGEAAVIDLKEDNILPGATRKYTTEWRDRGFSIGRYTADLTVTFADGEIKTESVSFTVFPYQTVVPVVIGSLAALLLVYKGRSRLTAAAKALKNPQK